MSASINDCSDNKNSQVKYLKSPSRKTNKSRSFDRKSTIKNPKEKSAKERIIDEESYRSKDRQENENDVYYKRKLKYQSEFEKKIEQPQAKAGNKVEKPKAGRRKKRGEEEDEKERRREQRKERRRERKRAKEGKGLDKYMRRKRKKKRTEPEETRRQEQEREEEKEEEERRAGRNRKSGDNTDKALQLKDIRAEKKPKAKNLNIINATTSSYQKMLDTEDIGGKPSSHSTKLICFLISRICSIPKHYITAKIYLLPVKF